MKNILILFLHTLFICTVAAQPYNIKRLGVEDGLSSNYVMSIAQDKNGYLWFGTEAGLNKFNGRQFTTYNKNNSKLSGNELNAILADPVDNYLWVATQRAGLCMLDCDADTFKVYTSGKGEQSVITNDITDLTASANGKGIWIATFHMGVNYFDKSTGKFTHYYEHNVKGLGGQKIYTSCDDGKGNLYIGHAFTGMSILSLKDNTLKNYRHNPEDPYSIPGNAVQAVCIDNNQHIWVGTDQGLALFNPLTERFTTFKHVPSDATSLLSDRVMDIEQMADGSLWICTNMGGVSILDMQQNTFISPNEIKFRNIKVTYDRFGLSGPNARCAFQDSFGNIWVGNYRGGIDFISYTHSAFNVLPYQEEKRSRLNYKQVWGLLADGENVYVGGEGELGLFRQGELRQLISLHPYQTRPNTHVNVIFKDSNGNIWLGTYQNGILVYRPDDRRIRRIGSTAEEEELNVHCFFEDTDGKVWIGTETGLYAYKNNKLLFDKDMNALFPDKKIHGVLRDKEQRLWIATFGKGIVVLDGNNKPSWNFVIENGFCSNAVNHIMKDSKERIWAATREGLALFAQTSNPGDYEVYKEEHKLMNSQVRAVQEDEAGQIWVSTNGGVARWDENERKFYNYNQYDEVPMGDFMSGSACITTGGTVYFGSQNGACYFNPRDVLTYRHVSPVAITQFDVYHNTKEGRDEERSFPIANHNVHLSYIENTFKVSYNVLDYTQSPQVEFAYMLEGLEDVWYNTQRENQVIFRNVPPGKYTFKVRTRIRNQEWDEKVATLSIHITPPLWLTWYAKLFYFLLAIGALYAFLSFYKRKLVLESSLEVERKKSKNEQELNNERLRFYTNITHELRTPLTLILGPLEDLLSDITLSPKHANKISLIHDSATRLLNLINRILEFRKTETQNRKLSVSKGNIAHLVQEIGLRYKELNPNSKVTFHTNIETEETELFFDSDMLTIILDNLMSNASKYTAEGSITLTLRSVEENRIKYTEISVSDTGYGIEPGALPHIFDRYYQAKSKYQASGSGIGLALVKGLADLHEGILSVESTPDVGTTFILRLLTENTYPNASRVHTDESEQADKTLVDESSVDGVSEGRPILLVVEDNMDIREYIRSSFADIYEVMVAGNGKEGLELAQKYIPNIIISDIMMPVMGGMELCRQIKDDMRTSHIPVILLTAKDSLKDKEEGYAAGADSYITKPFSAKLLHSRINNLLDGRKKIASLLLSNVEPRQEDGTESLNKRDNEFLQKITLIIEDNLSMEKMDISFIAEKMHMSHSTLYRKIKGLTDMSANEFIRKVKMRNAAKLLLNGGYTISEIAYRIGFSSPAYFRQCFKDEFGITPSDYIRENN